METEMNGHDEELPEEYFGDKKNWFQKMPLWARYLYYFVGGIVIGIMITVII